MGKLYQDKVVDSKIGIVTYVVIIFWVFMGIFASYHNADYTSLASYFVSLTGFVGTYIFSETKRKSTSSSIFKKGKSSTREFIIYFMIFIWATVGIWVIYNDGDLPGASAYFAALTPFVGSYILSRTYTYRGSSSAASYSNPEPDYRFNDRFNSHRFDDSGFEDSSNFGYSSHPQRSMISKNAHVHNIHLDNDAISIKIRP